MASLGAFPRIAIVGTAPSWDRTPWQDVELGIYSLNDAYNISAFQRADFWADLHPLDKFWLVPKKDGTKQPVVFAHQIPLGYYVRPADHLDWLATQNIPKFLHPDHVTQLPASATWPNVHPFPKAAIETAYGGYFTSSPQWMLAHALLEGVREIHIYGIHLSTAEEYRIQRAGFEYLIGCLLGPGKRTLRRVEGVRHYESQDGHVVIPDASPILSSNFQYAFEPSPTRAIEPLRWELHKAEVKRNRTIQALKTAWGPVARFEEPIPDDSHGKQRTRWAAVSTLQQELWYYDALVLDCQDAIGRAERSLIHG